MDEIYVTYVDDEHVDNHDYDDNLRELFADGPLPVTGGRGGP